MTGIASTKSINSANNPFLYFIDFQAWVIRSLDIMKLQLNQLQESVDVLIRGNSSTVLPREPHVDEFAFLPCTSLLDIEKTCKLIEEADKYRALV